MQGKTANSLIASFDSSAAWVTATCAIVGVPTGPFTHHRQEVVPQYWHHFIKNSLSDRCNNNLIYGARS
jgi:hypothetical protein